MDQVSKIIAYENGEMDANATVDFFAELIKSGLCWSLQGSYGRTATMLIDNGFVDREGNVLVYPE